MPDLSKSLGGFGTGLSETNATVWLAVSELYQGCSPSFGGIFNLLYTPLIYNATGPPPPAKYQINFNGNKNLCVQNQGDFAGSEVFIGTCNNLDSNYYSLNHGPTSITAGGTTFSLDAGASPGNGSPLHLEPKASTSSQNWYYTTDNRIAVTGSGTSI
jgi:hypothetical protein